jgi:hypothetical protein
MTCPTCDEESETLCEACGACPKCCLCDDAEIGPGGCRDYSPAGRGPPPRSSSRTRSLKRVKTAV